jgi:hypothetical protein
MKTHLLIAAFFFATAIYAQTEQYRVIKVQGEIQRIKTGSLLSSGDQFESNENLNFITDYSRAAVISPVKGRFILTAQGRSENNASKVNFLPPMNNLSSRATVNSAADIIDYFNGDVLFLGTDSLKYDPAKILVDENNYFAISYDKESVNLRNKIIASNGSLVIQKDSIFKTSAPKNVKIEYATADGKVKINEFTAVMPENEKLVQEVTLIINNSKTTNRDSIVNDVASYLNDFYGKVNAGSVSAWLKTTMKY